MLYVVEIRSGTLEEAVLRLCLQKYPITNRDIAKALGQRLDSVTFSSLAATRHKGVPSSIKRPRRRN